MSIAAPQEHLALILTLKDLPREPYAVSFHELNTRIMSSARHVDELGRLKRELLSSQLGLGVGIGGGAMVST